MFTGLVEEIGKIESVGSLNGGKRISIFASKILNGLKVGDSIAINGVCLTVTQINSQGFTCEAVGATLTKTTLVNVSANQYVNLERALLFSDRLGGHFVQGHVNGIGTISKIIRLGENYSVEITIPEELCKYIVNEGSIAVDGISLTVAEIINNKFVLSIIPHTWNSTILKNKQVGDKVNIETDIIAKYVENIISNPGANKNKFTDSWFKNLGY